MKEYEITYTFRDNEGKVHFASEVFEADNEDEAIADFEEWKQDGDEFYEVDEIVA